MADIKRKCPLCKDGVSHEIVFGRLMPCTKCMEKPGCAERMAARTQVWEAEHRGYQHGLAQGFNRGTQAQRERIAQMLS